MALIISLPVHGVATRGRSSRRSRASRWWRRRSRWSSAVARDGPGLRRLVERLARWVPGIDADRAVAALRRESEHLRALAADPPRLVAAVAWGAANWLLDATVLWVVLAAVGHTVDPLTLFIAYAVADVLGAAAHHARRRRRRRGRARAPRSWPLACPPSSRWSGVLGWRLVSYWLPIPVGALTWLTLRHHTARALRPECGRAAAGPRPPPAGRPH